MIMSKWQGVVDYSLVLYSDFYLYPYFLTTLE